MTNTQTFDDGLAPILVMGATSGIGKLALEEALSRNLKVRAFARSASDLDARHGLELCPGDALESKDVKKALTGVQSVIYALGIKERVSMLWQEETLFSKSTDTLLRAMEQSAPSGGTRRLVVVTGFGAGRSIKAMSSIERLGHRAILGRPYADKDRQEELVTQSSLDWTIVRPVILTNGKGTTGYKVLRDPMTWRNGLISRKDVAHYLVDAATQQMDLRADIVLSR
ncbi:MAG: NAD(P)-binding oxidoreductase [Pseudomonadota bacterium]